MRWLSGPPTHTGQTACEAVAGNGSAIVEMAIQTVGRALLLSLGIALFEKDPKKIAKQALFASLAIQSWIISWNNVSGCEPLPSGEAAQDFLDKKPGAVGALIGTMAFRTAMLAAGIATAGEEDVKKLWLKSLAAVTLIEGTVLYEASQGREASSG